MRLIKHLIYTLIDRRRLNREWFVSTNEKMKRVLRTGHTKREGL